jgi:homoserine dehydrogenase
VKEIGIGLIGFGTVGAGVVECLQKNGDRIAARTGVKLVLRKIADVDLERDRGVTVDPAILTKDGNSLLTDPSLDIIIELVGGKGFAKDVVLKALENGKAVVTANKALLAEYGSEIFGLAAQKGLPVGFEASVAGTIPIIRAIREGLVSNRFQRIYGILNGTCNFILTKMEKEQVTFEHALKEAQAAGYAEANSALDIDGFDTAHKAAILASLACGGAIPMSAVYVEGIRGLAKVDMENAKALGYRIKLLAVVKLDDGQVEVRVHPALIPADSLLASVSGVFNAVMVEGDMAGQTMYYGRGAGRLPTGSAVVSDLADIGMILASGFAPPPVFPAGAVLPACLPMGEVSNRYYIRLGLLDRPGVLGQIATVFGVHQISLASVVQKEPQAGRHVTVVLVTHRAKESDLAAALEAIGTLNVTNGPAVRLRIEDLGAEK